MDFSLLLIQIVSFIPLNYTTINVKKKHLNVKFIVYDNNVICGAFSLSFTAGRTLVVAVLTTQNLEKLVRQSAYESTNTLKNEKISTPHSELILVFESEEY